MYNVRDVALYIVKKSIEEEHPITNIQLQKMLSLIKNKSKDFMSSVTEKWAFGECHPNIYYKYCGFGAMPINMIRENFDVNIIEQKDRYFIDSIIHATRDLDPWKWGCLDST